jgi:hypothetical protein
MLEEKEEALRQINEIKTHLVDKQVFFPYNFRATYVWSIIAILMTLFMIPMYGVSILQGTVVSFVLITIGFVIEGMMTKKVNESYDIEACTLRQQFIMKSFLMMSLFLIALSAILASYQLYIPLLLTWLFMISLGYFSIGFVLNIKHFTQMANFNMVAAIILLTIGYINRTIEGISSVYLMVVQLFLVLGLGIMPAMIAWRQIREGK